MRDTIGEPLYLLSPPCWKTILRGSTSMASNLFSRSASRLSMPSMLGLAFLQKQTTGQVGFPQLCFALIRNHCYPRSDR